MSISLLLRLDFCFGAGRGNLVGLDISRTWREFFWSAVFSFTCGCEAASAIDLLRLCQNIYPRLSLNFYKKLHSGKCFGVVIPLEPRKSKVTYSSLNFSGLRRSWQHRNTTQNNTTVRKLASSWCSLELSTLAIPKFMKSWSWAVHRIQSRLKAFSAFVFEAFSRTIHTHELSRRMIFVSHNILSSLHFRYGKYTEIVRRTNHRG